MSVGHSGTAQRRSIEQVIAEFSTARDWAEAIGVSIAGSRFDQYPQHLEHLRAFAADPSARVQNAAEASRLTDAALLLQDVADLVRVHQYLGHVSSPALTRRLKEARRGPTFSDDETPNESKGRNILAELSFAAMLAANGWAVDIDHDPDIVLTIPRAGSPGVLYSIEVKRPQVDGQLRNNIRKASNQITKARRKQISVPGLIAGGIVLILLDKLYSYDDALIDGESTAVVERLLYERLGRWIADHKDALNVAADNTDVVGVVVLWRPLAFSGPRGNRSLTECFQKALFHYPGDPALPWRKRDFDSLLHRMDALSRDGQPLAVASDD